MKLPGTQQQALLWLILNRDRGLLQLRNPVAITGTTGAEDNNGAFSEARQATVHNTPEARPGLLMNDYCRKERDT